VQHPTPHEDHRPVRRAAQQAVSEGILEHVPVSVGILVKGGATCTILAFVHFVLGVDVSTTVVGGGMIGVGAAGAGYARGRSMAKEAVRPQDGDPPAGGSA
jgi:hypothetical protein